MSKANSGPPAKSAAALAALLLAFPVGALAYYQEIEITAATPGVTAGQSTGLFGPGTRNYVATYFVPSSSMSYLFGQRQSPIDSVMAVYDGQFNPSSPSTNQIGINDDGGISSMPGSTGAFNCGGSASLCPQVGVTLTTGQLLTLVVTSYSAGVPVGFPQVFYSNGPGSFTAGVPTVTPSVPIVTHSAGNILAGNIYNSNDLGVTVNPVFQGGTL